MASPYRVPSSRAEKVSPRRLDWWNLLRHASWAVAWFLCLAVGSFGYGCLLCHAEMSRGANFAYTCVWLFAAGVVASAIVLTEWARWSETHPLFKASP